MSIKPINKTHLFCRIAVGLFSFALICATAIPLLRTDAWWIRIFDFPRIQIAVLIGLTFAGYMALRFYWRLRPWEYTFAALLGAALVWQIISIAPYTAFYPEEMSASREEDDSNRISLLVYNVLSENRKVDELRDLIRETDPDLILLSEPNQWWSEQLQGLEKDYPYTLQQPQENNYGMLFFSRLELVNPEIRFLIDSDVPSIRSQVRLPSGQLVTLYGLHPRPPGLKPPGDQKDEEESEERKDSDMRDAELMLVAKEVKQLGNTPVIVAGDFNDVAWSHTTHLFQRTGGLLDPRVGRGLLNTYDTTSRLLRYPLDHSFASEHFLLADLRRLPDIGSDHFPLFVAFDYDPDASVVNDEPQPDAGDMEEAEEAIDEGQSKN
ncbi:MAG: endonuclease/exonuclease/phosphatase family protein [Pseudomonas sp.]|nr:endonuclease/exonuclease/phosphatase family protein [Pseudomonas sp.]MBQ0779092.1 endonuclease/exonuclease/phosphatase family protein [Pseudomonas sp.]